MKSFGETLKEMRESRGLLLRELAARLDVDPSFLSRVESGNKRITREQVIQLASILHEDKDRLLVLYLGDRVVYELMGDEALAMEAIMVAEKRIRYAARNSKKKRQGGATRSKN